MDDRFEHRDKEYQTFSATQSDVYPCRPVNNRVAANPVVADRLDDMFGRVQAIGKLADNWDSYDATKPSHTALVRLLDVVRRVIGEERLATFGSRIIPYLVAPLPDGGVQAEWRSNDQTIEIDSQPDGKFGYLLVTKKYGHESSQEADGLDEDAILDLVLSVVTKT